MGTNGRILRRVVSCLENWAEVCYWKQNSSITQSSTAKVDEYLVSYHRFVISRERISPTGRKNHSISLDAVANRIYPVCWHSSPIALVVHARLQSLYRLSYPGLRNGNVLLMRCWNRRECKLEISNYVLWSNSCSLANNINLVSRSQPVKTMQAEIFNNDP
jgi:hypothetical protein